MPLRSRRPSSHPSRHTSARGWSRLADEKPTSEQFAILYLEWEMAYPDEWQQDAGTYVSPFGLKGSILRAMDWHGVSEPDRAAVQKLLLAAVIGPYRAKDWQYTRVARHIDSRPLREALDTIAGAETTLLRITGALVLQGRWTQLRHTKHCATTFLTTSARSAGSSPGGASRTLSGAWGDHGLRGGLSAGVSAPASRRPSAGVRI
jgi:hypothetical protein